MIQGAGCRIHEENGPLSQPVLIRRNNQTLSIVLNRPGAVNSLDRKMVQLIREALDEAEKNPLVKRVLFYGEGEKGFCAGGDVKMMARLVGRGKTEECLDFLREEYQVDLTVHRLPKPVVVLADGITMGGGLGLCAGADIVLSTERTRSAMPETRIGFFPDVGATGWMFRKCPPGYPEYLGLTGYEMVGTECVRVGLTTHSVSSKDIPLIRTLLEESQPNVSPERAEAAEAITRLIEPFLQKEIPSRRAMDDWVEDYFAGKATVTSVVEGLRECSVFTDLCGDVFHELSERSPTALVMTLKLLRRNEGRTMEDVFLNDLHAARFILSHPDFLEGVRARLLDKDDKPRWQPETIEMAEQLAPLLKT
ncbi:MAG: enoyl-CoA hydratase/isomerase family protein [Desulfobacteraceae bacterium]|nr:MAG: enoyl-CoA hydratase/isomerase family protein [Desulfobacteraceae bacterium]